VTDPITTTTTYGQSFDLNFLTPVIFNAVPHLCHFNGVVSPCVIRRQLCKSHPQLPTTWGHNSN